MGIRPSMQKQMRRHLKLAGARVCELGDQFVGTEVGRVLARAWYQAQGCAEYVCLDANGLNGAISVDLNVALKHQPVGRLPMFDLVTDFGTGEHIWNQDQVWRTLHGLCKHGGHIVFDRPTQGYGGHCFYLLDRSVIAAFCHANNYTAIWIGRACTTRGELLRGILRKNGDSEFVTPQQGRYFKHIGRVAGRETARLGPDYHNPNLIAFGLVGKRLPPQADERTAKGIFEEDSEFGDMTNIAEAK